MIYTTYNLAVKHNACERALEAWVKHVGGIEKLDVDTQIPLTDILDVLGISDCLWALRTIQDQEVADIIATKFLIAVADRELSYFESKYPEDKRPCRAIEALRAYFLNPSNKTAHAVDDAYRATLGANLSVDDRDIIWGAARRRWLGHGAGCGSRARAASYDRWAANSALGGRALSEAELKWQTAKLKESLEEA